MKAIILFMILILIGLFLLVVLLPPAHGYELEEIKGITVDLKYAVIHHTAGSDVSAREIDFMHKSHTYTDERGYIQHWDGIGYHFVIRADGTIEEGRSLTKIGCHAPGRNDWVGIVLTGENYFTLYQIISLKELLKELGTQHIERHHEECPGLGLDVEGLQEWLKGE